MPWGRLTLWGYSECRIGDRAETWVCGIKLAARDAGLKHAEEAGAKTRAARRLCDAGGGLRSTTLRAGSDTGHGSSLQSAAEGLDFLYLADQGVLCTEVGGLPECVPSPSPEAP